MMDQNDAVRARLPFHKVKKQLADARKSTIPTSPASMEETICNLELGFYPQTYQDMYFGSADYTTKGKILFFQHILLTSFHCTYATFSNIITSIISNKYLKNLFSLFSAQGNTTKHTAIILVNQQVASTVVQECTFFFMDGTFRSTPRQNHKVLNLRSSQVYI